MFTTTTIMTVKLGKSGIKTTYLGGKTCCWVITWLNQPCERKVTMSMLGMLTRDYISTQGMLARKHESTQSTLAHEHISTQGTLVPEHVSTQDTLASEHTRHVGT